MKVLITGGGGALAQELVATVPEGIEFAAPLRSELDIRSTSMLHELFDKFNPDVVINAAAYTDVAAAESDRQEAYAVNSDGASNVARETAIRSGRLVQVSTDYVFGDLGPGLRQVDDPTEPLNVYGQSKLRGEQKCRDIMPAADLLIVRSGWLYSTHGRNFVRTMLDRMIEGDDLQVVTDQTGTPNWSHGLAETIWKLIERSVSGVQHWSYAGKASWYEFAMAIYEEANTLGILDENIDIRPVSSTIYGSDVKRPSNSTLDCVSCWQSLDETPAHWRDALREMLMDFKNMRDLHV